MHHVLHFGYKQMALIRLNKVTLEFPIYNAGQLSLRHKLVQIGTGGKIAQDHSKVVIVKALQDVSIEFRDGDSVGLVGHNGAGKSSLLRILSGIYQPLDGDIIVEGSVTMLLELGAGLDPELSGYENILRMGLLYGLTLNEAYASFADVEEFSELGQFLEMPVRTYSSGMMMRLMFAVATAKCPDILLVDEIINVGDESFKQKAKARLASMAKRASILVYASHDEDFLKQHCNRFLRLHQGSVTEVTL
jgi:ABC-type polysaccharide/polyol phosphate transport system ATPase subunit